MGKFKDILLGKKNVIMEIIDIDTIDSICARLTKLTDDHNYLYEDSTKFYRDGTIECGITNNEGLKMSLLTLVLFALKDRGYDTDKCKYKYSDSTRELIGIIAPFY